MVKSREVAAESFAVESDSSSTLELVDGSRVVAESAVTRMTAADGSNQFEDRRLRCNCCC